MNLCITSSFPLAFTRVGYFFFSEKYEKHFKNTRKILFCLIVYDLFIFACAYIAYNTPPSTIAMVGKYLLISLSILPIFFSLYLIVKIRQLMKIVGNSSKLATLKNLRRAAFVCLFQFCSDSIMFLCMGFSALFKYVFIFDEKSFNITVFPYAAMTILFYVIFTFKLIFDTIIMLTVLKSYRLLMVKILKKIVFYLLKKNTAVMHVSIQVNSRPIVN